MTDGNGFGIDFGTTNSSASRYKYNRITSQFTDYDEEGRPIPSIVAIDRETGQVFTGLDAWKKRSALKSSCECITSVKSILDDGLWNKRVGGHMWRTKDVACEILSKVKRVALESQNEDIRSATFAIPVGLKPTSRRVIRSAARDAGIKVEAFVSEPTAAFFAYYDELRPCERLVVFDWGGGTLDVSVLHHSRGMVTELATKSIDIAGDAIDLALAHRIHAIIARERGITASFEEMSARDQDEMLVMCERLKRMLSSRRASTIALGNYAGLGNYRKAFDYDWLAGVTGSIVDKAISCLDTAIAQSGSTDAGIDRVLMVGGSSNLKPVRERLQARFGERLFFPGDSGWSVSRGAAMLSDAPGRYVSAQDVSVVLSDGTPYPLLRKGERIGRGWKNSVEFGITDASQTLRVAFSGSSDIDEDPSRLRVVRVPGYGFLEEKLELEASVDQDLVFSVRMKSSMLPERDAKVWEYERLKLSYDVSSVS